MSNLSAVPRSLGSPSLLGWAGRELDQLFDDLVAPPTNGHTSKWAAPMTVWEEKDAFGIDIDLPGLSMDSIEVTFEEGRLTVAAKRERDQSEGRIYRHDERAWGQVSRTIRLPETVDPDSIEASFENGTLHVSLTKRPEVMPKKIEVKAK